MATSNGEVASNIESSVSDSSRSYSYSACDYDFTLLAAAMRTGHVSIMMSLIMTVLADDDANEGDLQFSIPRINARPGKGKYSSSAFSVCQCVSELQLS